MPIESAREATETTSQQPKKRSSERLRARSSSRDDQLRSCRSNPRAKQQQRRPANLEGPVRHQSGRSWVRGGEATGPEVHTLTQVASGRGKHNYKHKHTQHTDPHPPPPTPLPSLRPSSGTSPCPSQGLPSRAPSVCVSHLDTNAGKSDRNLCILGLCDAVTQ